MFCGWYTTMWCISTYTNPNISLTLKKVGTRKSKGVCLSGYSSYDVLWQLCLDWAISPRPTEITHLHRKTVWRQHRIFGMVHLKPQDAYIQQQEHSTYDLESLEWFLSNNTDNLHVVLLFFYHLSIHLVAISAHPLIIKKSNRIFSEFCRSQFCFCLFFVLIEGNWSEPWL